MAFLCDNAGTLNCYKLRTFVLLKMSGCLRKQLVYFDSFHGFSGGRETTTGNTSAVRRLSRLQIG